MLVNQYKKIKYPALVARQGKKIAATIDQHRNKAQLISFPLCAAERIAVFFVLLLAGISQHTITQTLKESTQISLEIQRAAQLFFDR